MEPQRPDLAVAGLAEVWGSMVALGESLGTEEFDLPTACPGWSVKDQFSHVIGTELLLEGAVAPAPPAPAAHVRNALGALNERFVAARRDRSGRSVVEELAALVERRLEALADLRAEAAALGAVTEPGLAPYVDYLGLRAFDCFVHEQDVRLATGRPGGRDGHGERVALDRLEAATPFVLGRRVAPPAGTTLRVEVTGPLGRRIQLVVREDGDGVKAVPSEVLDQEPTAQLRLDAESFVRRGCGRLSTGAVRRRRSSEVAGDASLAARFVASLVVVA